MAQIISEYSEPHIEPVIEDVLGKPNDKLYAMFKMMGPYSPNPINYPPFEEAQNYYLLHPSADCRLINITNILNNNSIGYDYTKWTDEEKMIIKLAVL